MLTAIPCDRIASDAEGACDSVKRRRCLALLPSEATGSSKSLARCARAIQVLPKEQAHSHSPSMKVIAEHTAIPAGMSRSQNEQALRESAPHRG